MKLGSMIIVVMLVITACFVYANWEYDPLPGNTKMDRILVEKSKRKMHLISNGQIVRTYTIALGFAPEGHKQREGDGRTPEGLYMIDSKNPHSGYHLNLGISYPNEDDRRNAAAAGVPPGGEIKIHGLRNGTWFIGRLHHLMDWTRGCIALTNDEMDELYATGSIGTPIEIRK